MAAVAPLLLALAVQRLGLLWCEARSIPLGTFWRSHGFELADMPDLIGRVTLVTGANTGLGLETSLQMALANATVLMACRSSSKCDAAVREVTAAVAARGSSGTARAVVLDLAKLRQVAEVADALLQELPRLDVLVNNAGLATQFPHRLSEDGVELTFQVNYLGHFLLTTRLLPLLLAAGSAAGSAPARVVHLTSGAHRGAPLEGLPLDLARLNEAATMGAYARYGAAKLANLVFAHELARRHRSLLSSSVHPGVVATDMLRPDNFQAMLGNVLGPVAWRLAQWRNALFAYTPRAAAVTMLFCAVAPDLEKQPLRNGELFVPVAARWPAKHPRATDLAFAAALWDFSTQLLSEALPDATAA